MIKAVLLISGLIFALAGLTGAIESLAIFAIKPKRLSKRFSVIHLNKENPHQQLYYATRQVRWAGRKYADYIIALSDELDEEKLLDCQKLCDMNNIILCPKAALNNVLESLT